MRSFTVLLLVALAAGAYSALTKDQTAKSVELAQACIKEGGVDPEAVKKLKAGDFSDNSSKIQCFALCFLQKAGLMDASGNVQEAVAIEKLSAGTDKAKVTSAVTKCKSEKGANACETAHKVYKCYFTNIGGVL